MSPAEWIVLGFGIYIVAIVIAAIGLEASAAKARYRQSHKAQADVVDLSAFIDERASRARRATFAHADRLRREFDESHSFRTRVGVHKEAAAPREWPTA